MLIELSKLKDHPDNANVMPNDIYRSLLLHIRETGNYPPVIVRRMQDENETYQILDGHHRVIALRELKLTHANCDIWNVDDKAATMLLLTLNRLQGRDDPYKRAALIKKLCDKHPERELIKRLPETRKKLRSLLELHIPPPLPVSSIKVDDLPVAVTFFLAKKQRDSLFSLLKSYESDRSNALVSLLEL